MIRCSCPEDIELSQRELATHFGVPTRIEEAVIDPNFVQRMRSQETLVRVTERRTFTAKSREFPKGDHYGDRLAASRQLNLPTAFHLIDDGWEVRTRFRNGVSFRHTSLYIMMYSCASRRTQPLALAIAAIGAFSRAWGLDSISAIRRRAF